jgi:uncharacterized protein YlaN (UPF0358 family)
MLLSNIPYCEEVADEQMFSRQRKVETHVRPPGNAWW